MTTRALQNALDALDPWLDAHHDELIAFRRHLHAHPELSGEEYRTTEFIVERLQATGLNPVPMPGKAGLVCDVGGEAGRVTALRADLDALAMDDEKQVAYRSTRQGVAHACGHDVHTTVVLGAGLALHDLFGDASNGTVRLLFQSAEERVPGGAIDMIEAGVLDDVDAIFGLHCDPKIDVGRVGLRAGAITSAADMMRIELHGPGGHTARPERTADLVAVAADVVRELSGEVSRRLGGRQVHVVFGAVQAGDAPNVIPARAELRGTIRTPEPEVWNEVHGVVERALASITEPRGAGAELDYTRGHPPVINDEWATNIIDVAAHTVLGDHAVVPTVQSVGGDDFSWYLQQVRGCYARLGVRDPAAEDPAVDLHASHFDVDERCIDVGVRLLVATAVQAMASPPP